MARRTLSFLELLSVALLILLAISSSLAFDPYKILGVSRQATVKEVKRAYRRLSKRWHPDKNPSDKEASQKFLEITRSLEVLSDSERRHVYDTQGEEGLKRHDQGGQGGGDPFDVFRQFFGGGGGGGGGRQRGQRKNPTMVTEMEVELEDIYIGRSIDFEINRQILCPVCKGSGARKPSDVANCGTCGGQGIRIVRHQLGPGIFQQMQMQCDVCGGRGRTITHKCPHCHGGQTVEHVNSLTVDLDRGSADGHEELFEGEGDEGPDTAAGDVVLRIRIRKQSGGGFRRLDENLYWKETLSLDEALLGFTRKVKHLDGHQISLTRKLVTQPGFVDVIEGEGMPRYQALGHGDLFVEYSVVLPFRVEGPFKAGVEKLFGTTQERMISKNEQDEHQEL